MDKSLNKSKSSFAYDIGLDYLTRIIGYLFISRFMDKSLSSIEIQGKKFVVKFDCDDAYSIKTLDITSSDGRMVKFTTRNYSDSYRPHVSLAIQIFNTNYNDSVILQSNILKGFHIDEDRINNSNYVEASSWEKFLDIDNLSYITFLKSGGECYSFRGKRLVPATYYIINRKIKLLFDIFTREELNILQCFISSYVEGILERNGINASEITNPSYCSSILDGSNPHNFLHRSLIRDDFDD